MHDRQDSPELKQRIAAIAEAWRRIVRSATSDREAAPTAETIVDRLARRTVDLLTQEPSYEQSELDALADDLIALQLPPETLGELQGVLVRELVDAPSRRQAAALPTAPSRLIAELTAALLCRGEAAVRQDDREVEQTYEALQSARRQLRIMDAAIESSVTAIALWTLAGEITYVNPAVLAMWGRDDPQALLGQPVASLWVNEPPFETIQTSVEQAGGWIGKLRAVRPDGSQFTVMLSASLAEPEPDDEIPAFAIGAFVDMTHREQLNAMLWDQVDRLRALQQVDRRILAATSPEEIARAALSHLLQLIPCRSASILIFRPRRRAEVLAVVPPEAYGDALEGGISLADPDEQFPESLEEILDTLRDEGLCHVDDPDQLPFPAPVPQPAGPDDSTERPTLALISLRCNGGLLGLLSLVLEPGSRLQEQPRAIAAEVADSLAVAIRHARMAQATSQHRQRLQELTARLAEHDEAERRRMARDLHDEIGQKLTALGINLHVIKARLSAADASRLAPRLDDSLQLLKATGDQVRRVIADLRPPMLDDYGLLPTLRWCGDQLEARGDVDVVVKGEDLDPRLPSPVEDALVRITQEALTNVLKHAQASHVTVTLSEEQDAVRLEISDDGLGFAVGATDLRHRGTWGLITMVERAEAVDATCRIESEPGEGTTVTVEVSRSP